MPRSTLSSAAGLPVAPFRTGDRPAEKGRGQAQQSPAGYVFKGNGYRVTLDGDGHATGLVVGHEQVLSNADGPWGGSNLSGPGGNRRLSKVTPDGTDRLVCRGDDASATLAFDEAAVHWSVTHRNAEAPMTFTLALTAQAPVTRDGTDGPVVVRRKGATLTVTGVDEVATFEDPSADAGGKVLKVTVPPGQTRTLDLVAGR